MDKIEYIIIHHSATKKETTNFNAVNEYHLSLGWKGIGYHYFIEEDGTVKQGRDENTEGAHCRSDRMNHRSIGICLAGNFTEEEPSVGQLASLQSLLDLLRKRYDIPRENVLGHKEVNGASTVCPASLLDHIKAYRQGEDENNDTRAISEELDEALKHISLARESVEKIIEMLK